MSYQATSITGSANRFKAKFFGLILEGITRGSLLIFCSVTSAVEPLDFGYQFPSMKIFTNIAVGDSVRPTEG